MELYWADARAQLRVGATTVRVPKEQRFDAGGVIAALESAGPLPEGPAEPADIVQLMLSDVVPLSNCGLTFLDLFLQGLTDAANWSVYFNMDLFVEVAHAMQELVERDSHGLGIGADSYDFIDRYIAFLVAYDLARVDYDAFKRSAEQARLVGIVLGSLTDRGRAIVDYIAAVDHAIPNADGRCWAVVERPISILLQSDLYERTARIAELKKRLN
jgi:hypothetical protein